MVVAPPEFWNEIRGRRSTPPPATYTPRLPERDDHTDEPDPPDDHAPPSWAAQSITGRTIILTYIDSHGQGSERQVLCRQLAINAGALYLQAWCFLRERLRTFRGDRIAMIVDPETGEVFEPGMVLLAQFHPDATTPAPFHYGLAPRQFADFNAALNVLAFIARCDGRWHPLEGERIEAFAASYWLRAEIAAPFDEAEITRHANRLAPDAESFWVSLTRCAGHPVLAPIIRRHIAAVIDADGVHHPHEHYWGAQVDAFLTGR